MPVGYTIGNQLSLHGKHWELLISGKADSMEVGYSQVQTMCTSVVDISNGKAKPVPRRLVLTATHLLVQKNSKDGDDTDSNRPTHGSVSDRGFSGGESFDSYVDTSSPPPENNKREVTLTREEGVLGVSVRGGAEHSLPLIISRLAPGSPASLCKQLYVGDAILAINGKKITKMGHEEAVQCLNTSGPSVTLKLKYFSTAKSFLSGTQQYLLENHLNHWEATENEISNDHWETEKSLPLLFALLTRYLGGTDRLRCNAFEVKDSTGNSTTGIIHCGDSYALTSWIKIISDIILGLNNVQIKLWTQETQMEIYYVGWVWEGTKTEEKSSSTDVDSGKINQSWLSWKPKVLAIRGNTLHYMEYPPGVASYWDGSDAYDVMTTLLRVVSSAGEHLDERQNCFTLQIATDEVSNNCKGGQPLTLYLSTETRQELIKVETAWTKAVTDTVKSVKKCRYPVWWGGKPSQLELDFIAAAFNLYRASSKPSPPLWTYNFSSLKSSSDDSRTRLTLKFHGKNPPETMECQDLHKILFTIHSFLLAKVVH